MLLEIPSAKTKDTSKTGSYRKLKDVDMHTFKQELQVACSSLDYSQPFESVITTYDDLSRKIVDRHAPVLSKARKAQNPPWIDQEFRKNRALRCKAERDWRKNRTEENRIKYIEQKRLCIEMSITKRTVYYSEMVQGSLNCQKSLFKIANELLDKSSEKVLPAHVDSRKLANDFNDYYVDKVKKIRDSIPQEIDIPNYYSRPFKGNIMYKFRETTELEVEKLIKDHGIKTSAEDPIPSKLLISSLDILLPVLTKMVNKSLSEGCIDGVKWSIIDPLLKKAGLDTEKHKNYRPVNNIVYFSKLTERVVASRLEEHMNINNLHESTQFAYKREHNIETMMIGLTDEVLRGFDNNMATIVIFFDLSAAFDTIDIGKLLQILKDEIGIDGIALKWFKSFLTGRTQRVKINGQYSESLEVPCGAPQGSVLGPKIFNINVRSQPTVFKQCLFTTSSFADDSNGRRSFALTFQFEILKNNVVNCMRDIITWSNVHFMKINPDKTELLLFRPSIINCDVKIKGVIFDGQCLRFSEKVKNVGVILDSNLTLNKHVNNLVSHCYKILRDIGRVKKYMNRNQLETLVHAVIASRIDNCNSLLINIHKDQLFKIQKVQNSAARLILGKRRRDSGKQALKELHWLNVDARITFKILLVTFKIVKGKCGSIALNYKSFNGRESDFLMLETPNFKTKYGKRIFAFNASRLWNVLPIHMRREEDIEKFKKMLKTLLFDGHDELKRRAFKYNS